VVVAVKEKLIIEDPVHVGQIRAMYSEGASHPEDSFGFVACELFDEWRWGVIKLLVIKDQATDKPWGTLVREQTGDNYYCSLDEDSEITFEPVVAVQRIEYVLERMAK
jgi:hypothetical protein